MACDVPMSLQSIKGGFDEGSLSSWGSYGGAHDGSDIRERNANCCRQHAVVEWERHLHVDLGLIPKSGKHWSRQRQFRGPRDAPAVHRLRNDDKLQHGYCRAIYAL